jgi:hypothetical protein
MKNLQIVAKNAANAIFRKTFNEFGKTANTDGVLTSTDGVLTLQRMFRVERTALLPDNAGMRL